MAEMKNSLETTKLKKSFRKQVKMTEIENIRRQEDSSYRFIFKIISILRKENIENGKTKVIQENFTRTEMHEFLDEKNFPGACTVDSQQDNIFLKFQNSCEREKILLVSREEK